MVDGHVESLTRAELMAKDYTMDKNIRYFGSIRKDVIRKLQSGRALRVDCLRHPRENKNPQ